MSGKRNVLPPEMQDGLRRTIEAAGSSYQLAADLGINRSSIGRWKRVPVERVGQIEKLYGVPRAILRPDIFGKDA